MLGEVFYFLLFLEILWVSNKINLFALKDRFEWGILFYISSEIDVWENLNQVIKLEWP